MHILAYGYANYDNGVTLIRTIIAQVSIKIYKGTHMKKVEKPCFRATNAVKNHQPPICVTSLMNFPV